MLKNRWEISSFPVITQTEIETDLDAILDRIERGEGPFVILSNDGQRLILIGWEDYWSHFGLLYPLGERERIEEECRRQLDSEPVENHERKIAIQ